jgi:hypothetical protein
MKGYKVKLVDLAGKPVGETVRLQPESDEDIDKLNAALAAGKPLDSLPYTLVVD